MPTRVTSFARHFVGLARGATPMRWSPPVTSAARWSRDEAKAWHDDVGWLVGCNFAPSTAGNQLEMWQAETFDPATCDRELGWAASLGMNCVRVFLHDLVWEADGQRFLDRVETFLGIADTHGITVMPVLFDGVWNPNPRLGPQPEPRPGVHNSIWVQGPGAAVLSEPSRWPPLRDYVEAVVTRFAHDRRVRCWDLFNEPDQANAISYPREDIAHKSRLADQLLGQIFDWAEAVDPDQPLTAGVFVGVSGATERVSRINRTMLSRSDVISFHSYSSAKRLESAIAHLSAYDRPLLCTEWLARSAGSTVDLLEVFQRHRVGAFNWGLVDGRTQTKFPWTSWLRPVKSDEVWFHELFHPDGRPYSETEAETFRRLTDDAGS
ncbi:MAG: 1,4-beta-xylanase [Acidobacteria bacterium]|nr:1,4-beta-xylanase [Acidobacteriota bacterium]